MRMPIRLTAFAVTALVLITACSSSTGSTWTIAPLHPTPSPDPSAAPTAGPTGPAGSPGSSGTSARTVAIDLTSNLQFKQDGVRVTELEVREGETIHFMLDNTSNFGHDFYIGPTDALAAGTVDGLPGVPQWESGVKELDYVVTADTATLQFGCTVPGHFQSMQGSFKLVP